jgi:hypothetical protein
MALVDDRGRLFGRLNVIDAFLVLLLMALIPLGYAAYVLFKTPPPRLTSVEPTTVQYSTAMRITVRGEDLRPYMRIVVGDYQGRNFLFYNANTAEVDLPEISPGTYDVALYDYAQERSRLVKALTIAPPPLPTTQIEIVGAFRNLTLDHVKKLPAGLALGTVGTIQKVGEPVRSLLRANAGDGMVEIPIDALDLPAVVRIGCYLKGSANRVECVGAGVALVPDAYVMLPTPLGTLPFQIDQVQSPVDVDMVEARVRFLGDVHTLNLIKPRDVDIGVVRNPLASGAVVTDASPVSAAPSTVTVLSPSQVLTGTLAMRDVTLQVPAQPGVTGWRYANTDLRSGAVFKLATMTYEVTGSVLRVTPETPPARAGTQ